MEKKKCLRCNYEWISRVDDPIQCPRCKRMDWDKEKEEKSDNLKISQ